MLEIILTGATFCLAIVSAIAGIFGMNLANGNESSFGGFVFVTIASCLGAVVTFVGILLFMRWRKLMLI